MHYQHVRSLIMSIQSYHITELNCEDCHPSFYNVETIDGYTIHLSPFYRWLYIRKNGKVIGRLTNRCHEAYIVAFQLKIYQGLLDGVECDEYIRKCFIEDIKSEPCPYR